MYGLSGFVDVVCTDAMLVGTGECGALNRLEFNSFLVGIGGFSGEKKIKLEWPSSVS